MKDKSLIVGKGASSFGIAAGIFEKFGSKHEIVVISPNLAEQNNEKKITQAHDYSPEAIAKIYQKIRAVQNKIQFPPPKTLFGQPIPTFDSVCGNLKIYDSIKMGSLTKFWGGGMVPFIDKDFEGWNKRKEIKHAYKKLMSYLEITGSDDELGELFTTDHFNTEFTN